MPGLKTLDVSEFTDLNSVARWYIVLRWVAIVGVAMVLVLCPLLWPWNLPVWILVGITLALAAFNGVCHWYFAVAKDSAMSRSEIGRFFEIQILVDYLLLFLLVYFTGFLENPFLFFFIFHILLTAYIFTAQIVWRFVAILVAAAAAVAGLELSGAIPHFSLYGGLETRYRELLLPRLLGFCSTIAISGYLGSSINRRLKDSALTVEIELNRYKSLDKIKSNFILQVTHELRGPLAAVKGYHEMIERGITGPVPAATVEVLGKATRRTDGLLTMIDEMLDYAYMESDDKLRFAPMNVPLHEAIVHNVEAQADAAKAKGIAIEHNCAPDLAVRINRDLLNIILSNLISNAIRYSYAHSNVVVQATREESEVALEVRDEGIGMSSDELEHIFEEFYRTRKAREVERDGTGLGLSIIKKAVEGSGGRIKVASEQGKGSSFRIYLPKEG